jgi:hypothetical protein
METEKSIRRRWLAFVGPISLVPMTALADSDAGTITVAEGGTAPACIYGYSGSLGSYSPTELTGGEIVNAIFDLYWGMASCVNTESGLKVNGFTSSPGESWLTSVTCNGVKRTGASGTYSYSSGTATWVWEGLAFGFIVKVGDKLSCTIVHS